MIQSTSSDLVLWFVAPFFYFILLSISFFVPSETPISAVTLWRFLYEPPNVNRSEDRQERLVGIGMWAASCVHPGSYTSCYNRLWPFGLFFVCIWAGGRYELGEFLYLPTALPVNFLYHYFLVLCRVVILYRLQKYSVKYRPDEIRTRNRHKMLKPRAFDPTSNTFFCSLA